jgi:hypothetical protein
MQIPNILNISLLQFVSFVLMSIKVMQHKYYKSKWNHQKKKLNSNATNVLSWVLKKQKKFTLNILHIYMYMYTFVLVLPLPLSSIF